MLVHGFRPGGLHPRLCIFDRYAVGRGVWVEGPRYKSCFPKHAQAKKLEHATRLGWYKHADACVVEAAGVFMLLLQGKDWIPARRAAPVAAGFRGNDRGKKAIGTRGGRMLNVDFGFWMEEEYRNR